MLASIRVSISNPNLIFGAKTSSRKTAIIYGVVIICLTPFLPLIIGLQLQILYLKERLIKGNEDLSNSRSMLKFHLYNMVKLELGLESIHQLSLQMILMFNALTETGTSEGFRVIFKEGLDVWSIILLSLSIMWSFSSCCLSHLKCLNLHRVYFPFVSQVMAGAVALFSISKRVLCTLLYFTPPLGLFSILRHLQAEQTRWDIYEFVDETNGTIQFGNSPLLEWSTIDRWDHAKNEAPNYTFYSIFTLKIYFWIFVVITFCQLMTIFCIKQKFAQAFHKFNLLEKAIHCMESCNIPYPCEDWDVGVGNAEEHSKRMNQNKVEVILVILINNLYNCILLVPIFVLGM